MSNSIENANTIQQKIFTGDNMLKQQNDQLQSFIMENEAIVNQTTNEYEQVKQLLKKYKIVKEHLENTFLLQNKKLNARISELQRNNDELTKNQENFIERFNKNKEELTKFKTYIDKIQKPIKSWSEALMKLREKGEWQENQVKNMLQKTGLNKQKIDEYWEIIKKMDLIINKLNLTVNEVKGYMTIDQRSNKHLAEQLGDLKKKLIKTTEQIGGKNIHKYIKLYKIKNDIFLKFLSNPVQFKIKSNNISINSMTGGIKSSKSLWIKDSSSYIFKNFTRKELNNIANKWGIENTKKYKNKLELSKALKILMLYKGGMIKGKHNINIVCKNVDQNYNTNKIKTIKKLLDSKLKSVSI